MVASTGIIIDPLSNVDLVSIWTDVHKRAKNAIPFNPDRTKELVFLGDIFCRANIKKSEVALQTAEIEAWEEILGPAFVKGNHERWRDKDRLYKIRPRVGGMHGDHIFWGAKRSEKYRAGELGLGVVKYQLKGKLWVEALDAFENGYNRKVEQEDLDRAFGIAVANNIDVLIVGHLHPDEMLVYEIKKLDRVVKFIVLPRGETTLDMNNLPQFNRKAA